MSVHTAVVAVFGTTAVGALGYPLYVAIQSDRPSAQPFAVLLAATLLWTICATVPALNVLPTAITSIWVWDVGAGIGALCVPVAWLAYTRTYTGRKAWRTPSVIGLSLLASLFIGTTQLLAPNSPAALAVTVTIVFSTHAAVLVAVGYGTWLVSTLARAYDRVSPWQIVTLLGLVTAPFVVRLSIGTWAAVQFALADIPIEQSIAALSISDLPIGFLVAGICATIGIHRYPVLAGFPQGDAVARATIVRDLREPVIVLDYDGRILDINNSTTTVFDWDPETVSGRSLASVEPDLARLDLSQGTTDTVWLMTNDGRRQFQYSVSPVGDAPQDRDPIARALLLRDVTDRRTREQRLQVLNRVLRHNIRNDIDVLLAHANGIEDPTVRDHIRDTANGLARLGTKARDAERTMAAASEPPTAVDLVDLLQEVLADYEDEMAGTTVDAPSSLTITTHEPVLRTVFEELVENTVVHAVSPPTVEVTLDATTDRIRITIADDGPGIPDHDRAVLEQGVESQLSHVTGIGLWLVRWAVTQLGGEITLTDRDPTGTAVTVTLYSSRLSTG